MVINIDVGSILSRTNFGNELFQICFGVGVLVSAHGFYFVIRIDLLYKECPSLKL